MANIIDYIAWRGDLSMARDGWNDVDALIMANYCYNDLAPAKDRALGELAGSIPDTAGGGSSLAHEHVTLLRAMAASRRFGAFVVRDGVDTVDAAAGMQFSAATADAPDGLRVVSFRGTDGTLVGWRENFNMAYESPVPAQTAAAAYLERAAAGSEGPLLVTGHSKGGNLALYAAVHADEAVRRRVVAIYSFDGPGLDEESVNSAGYEAIRSRVRSFVPQSSVIGMLLSYHPDYIVVHSAASGLQQHNAYSWQVLGARFVTEAATDKGSQVIDQTLRGWLKSCTPEQRQRFVDTIFDVLKATNAESLSDLKRNVVASASAIIDGARQLDGDTARSFYALLGKFVLVGAGSLRDQLRQEKADPIPPPDDQKP